MRVTLGLTAAALMAMPAALAAQAAKPDLVFKYVYPPQAQAIPPLRAWFDAQSATLRAKLQAQVAADRRQALAQGQPFLPYEADRTWKVVTDLPRFLSLSMTSYDFTDGAHGMDGFGTLVWDRQANRRLSPLSFFTDAAMLDAAIRPAFCRQLDVERARKRRGSGDASFAEFNQCIDPLKETLILGSSSGTHFDRLGILVPPYDAGPYVEGTYQVTLPVTPAILAAVKPEWRRYFAAAGTP